MFEVRVVLQRGKVTVARRKKTIFGTMMDGLLQGMKRLVTIALKRMRRGQGVMNVIGLGRKLQRVLKMFDGGTQGPAVQIRDADVVMIFGGSKDRLPFFVNLLLRC